eukprot:TRINITY_DN2186_c0_g2_i2.p2 TRINITY_DN2186_c0_g2~~TRINITY_DN2186_c0_g2_i2.p2  ORF type:complete len:651 (+),score=56.49 TRINITY_DN2186_c0_g2_i2:5174-7126(+)
MAGKDKRALIAQRVGQELCNGDVVNLGIGIPTLVANYLPQGVSIILQSENGFLGLGPEPKPEQLDCDLVNAGGEPVTILPGGVFFDSAMSFAIIRGGHVATTVFGALEVDEAGNLANWMVPGKRVPGMGGAMDLVVGANRVIVAMEHVNKDGSPKIVPKCSMPLTAKAEVDLIFTDMAVIAVRPDGLHLQEIAADTTVEAVTAATGAKLIIPAGNIKTFGTVAQLPFSKNKHQGGSNMKEAVIVSAVRTPVGSFNGALAPLSAVDMGSIAIKAVLERGKVAADLVEEVIMGNVLQAGLGQNPARQAAVKAGIPQEVAAYTINKVCGSGLKAVILAAQSILAGDAEVVVAGGMESMTNAPYLIDPKARWGLKMGNSKLTDVMIHDGLWCAFNDYHMGITAENVAAKFGISREEQDKLAAASQEKALKAIESGKFKQEIVPVFIKGKKGEIIFDTDEYPRAGTTVEGLAKLKPAFKKDGTVTAGNASGINDGAAALVIMSADKAKGLGLKPLARIRSYAAAGVDPSIMGVGPLAAVKKALAKAKISVKDLDLIEANEAFAAQFLAVGKELGFAQEKVNIHGGAIALGHPIGASGARVLVTLVHAMQQEQAKLGLATLCIGGGQGVAAVIERLQDNNQTFGNYGRDVCILAEY